MRQPVNARPVSPARIFVSDLRHFLARIARLSGSLVVTLNPSDAALRSLSAGELARVHNSVGVLCLPVAVSDDVPCGVAVIPKGRWPKLEAAGGNVNALNPGLRSDLADSSAVHGTEVWVAAAAANGVA